jgi:hypothetical protein
VIRQVDVDFLLNFTTNRYKANLYLNGVRVQEMFDFSFSELKQRVAAKMQLVLCCQQRCHLGRHVCQPFFPEDAFDGAGAEFSPRVLLYLGSYITSTEAFWKCSCHANVLHCCSICFVRSAWSGLVDDMTKLLISRNPPTNKIMTALHFLDYCTQRPFWVVLMKGNSFKLKFLTGLDALLAHYAVKQPASASNISCSSSHLCV